MKHSTFAARRLHTPRRRSFFRPSLEQLETRDLLSIVIPNITTPEIEPNDTLNHSQPLTFVSGSAIPVLGAIGNNQYGGADVDWYTFTLGGPTEVDFTVAGTDSANLDAVLSLFNTNSGHSIDPTAIGNHRLLTQVVGTLGRPPSIGTSAGARTSSPSAAKATTTSTP